MADKNISYKRGFLNPKELIQRMGDIPNKLNIVSSVKVLFDSYRFGKKYTKELKLNVGSKAPNFTLPNALGNSVTLYGLLEEQNVVLIFYRGGWCPFFNMQLRVFQNALDDFKSLGATIVAISPQLPDKSLSQEEKLGLKFHVLSDKRSQVAKKFTGMLNYKGKSAEALNRLGIDLNDYNNNDCGEVPIPAVFVINSHKKIIFAQSEGGDYKKRVEPLDVQNALRLHKK